MESTQTENIKNDSQNKRKRSEADIKATLEIEVLLFFTNIVTYIIMLHFCEITKGLKKEYCTVDVIKKLVSELSKISDILLNKSKETYDIDYRNIVVAPYISKIMEKYPNIKIDNRELSILDLYLERKKMTLDSLNRKILETTSKIFKLFCESQLKTELDKMVIKNDDSRKSPEIILIKENSRLFFEITTAIHSTMNEKDESPKTEHFSELEEGEILEEESNPKRRKLE